MQSCDKCNRKRGACVGIPVDGLGARKKRTLIILYQDRGGPAQLGIRDWAGLKGHGHDRNLACSLVAEGRSESPRGRLGVTPAGTERQKVGFGRVRIGLIRTMEAMQLNAKKCHTKEGSMPVDIELVEVD